MEGLGESLRKLPTSINGWFDVELHMHSSAFETIRYVYKFDGGKYDAVSCDVVTKGRSTPCTFNWRER